MTLPADDMGLDRQYANGPNEMLARLREENQLLKAAVMQGEDARDEEAAAKLELQVRLRNADDEMNGAVQVIEELEEAIANDYATHEREVSELMHQIVMTAAQCEAYALEVPQSLQVAIDALRTWKCQAEKSGKREASASTRSNGIAPRTAGRMNGSFMSYPPSQGDKWSSEALRQVARFAEHHQ
ncbi:hypothetical protein DIPPA_34583 [Diplonema papillatum]|nr:hypothetical protein DIPPA_34583 [Diplonema papillatum]